MYVGQCSMQRKYHSPVYYVQSTKNYKNFLSTMHILLKKNENSRLFLLKYMHRSQVLYSGFVAEENMVPFVIVFVDEENMLPFFKCMIC
jgi:hypothetical protein